MATLPFIRPDGTPTLVDRTHAQDAVNSGYKPAIRLARPDGSQTTVAFDDLHHALDAGYKQIGDTQQAQPEQPQGAISSIGRFLGGAGGAIGGAVKGIYHAATDPAFQNPIGNAAAMATGVPQAYRALVAPQIQQGQQAVQAFQAPDAATKISGIGHALAAVTPGIGPLVANTEESVAPDVASGNYAGAAGKIGGTALLGELARRGVNSIEAAPTNLTPQQIAARNIAKAVLPKEGDFNSLTDVLQREKGNVEQYAGKNGLTTRTPLDTGVAARSSANDLNSFYNEKLLAPHAAEQVPVPMNFEDVGSRSINGSRYANLGQINARVGQLNDLLRAGQNNATVGQTMTDLAKMADLQAEKTALTDILHNKLGELNGLDPNAVAGIRQSVGARYELADQLQSGANRTTLKAGQADRTGSTISKPTVTSTAIDAYNRIVRGGPEKIATRAFQKTYPQLDVPVGVGNPASLEELGATKLTPPPQASIRTPLSGGSIPYPTFDASPDSIAIQNQQTAITGRIQNRIVQTEANKAIANREFLRSNQLEQAAQDASKSRSSIAEALRVQNANKLLQEQMDAKATSYAQGAKNRQLGYENSKRR